METPAPPSSSSSSTPSTDPPPPPPQPSTSSSEPQPTPPAPPSSTTPSDPSPAMPSAEPTAAASSSSTTTATSNSAPIPSQTLETVQQQQIPPSQTQPQQQQRPLSIPRTRASTQSSMTRGLAIGVPAGYSHHQPPSPFSSFRPSNPFAAAPSPSFAQPFAAMPRASPSGSDQTGPQSRQPVPGSHIIGTIGSLSTAQTASQLRPSGASGQMQQRFGQSQARSISPSANQPLNPQKVPSHASPRGPSITSPSSQSPATQGPQPLHQQWIHGPSKQTHAASLPHSSFRPPMKPMQQRPQQQQQLPLNSHNHQVSASHQQLQQQQKQQQTLQLQQMQQQQQLSTVSNQSQELQPGRNQPSVSQNQATRASVPTTSKSNAQVSAQPGLPTSAPHNDPDPDESSSDIISRKRIRELVTQVDRTEKLRPEVEDDLLEIADDFVESIVTAACQLAKHRKSTTLEAKDILLHVERHWNMTLPGFSGDEIKCYKKPSTNDVHKERMAVIKKSMVVSSNDGGNAKTPASATGLAAAGAKHHAA